MTVVNVHVAKTHLSQLLERVENGEEIVLGRAGRPVAMLVPFRPRPARRKPGTWRGRVWIAPDFDELPEDIRAGFAGERP